MPVTLILLQVYFHIYSDVHGEDLSIIGKHSTADIRCSINVGGLTHTCGSVGLGSGRPHHITTKTSLYGLACLMGAVKPSHPILPSLLSSLPPSTVFSVSFAVSITPINGFLSHQVSRMKTGLQWQRSAIIQSRGSNECMWSCISFPFASLFIFSKVLSL